jgi:hypothetical protein
MEWCRSTGVRRDLIFQSLWYVMICTGCRPEELHTANIRLTSNALEVRYNGRKSESASGANYLRYPFSWSAAPPSTVQAFLKSGERFPIIGTRRNVAACFNSWLVSFRPRQGMPPPNLKVTSTCPRVRMDNVLRDQLDDKLITIEVFERLMGHKVQVSDQSYRR